MNQAHVIDAFPLSPLQQGMLFHHLQEQRSGVDIEQLVVHLAEPVDAARLEAAWQWLVKRHDILRARFVWEDLDQPMQEILSTAPIPFVVDDILTDPPQDQQGRLASFLRSDRIRGFEMNCAPMARLTLFLWGDASATLIWTFHHALLDGRSFSILLQEVFEVYAELERGDVRPRPAPPQYRRYIDWLQARNFDLAEAYWKELLRGFTAPTPLMIDCQTQVDDTVNQQGEAWETLDSAATTRLQRFAVDHELTVNSLVMGAWAILLHRYSGEGDIVFGATRACRKSSVAQADATVGLFINTAPVRVRFSGEDSLLAVFKAIRQQWLDMRPHEHTPLTRVKAVSSVPPALPLFQTLVVFENYRLDKAMQALGGPWANRQIELHELTNFPITLAAYDGEELSFKIEYDRSRLDDKPIERLLGHLRNVMESVAVNPLASVKDVPLVGTAERRELIKGLNAPAAMPKNLHLPLDGATTLPELFESQVAKVPNQLALSCDGVSLTYAELNLRANRLAHHLRALGVGPDVLVGLCLERCNELVVALLAILKAGGAYLPIDLAYPAERLAFMLEDARAPVLLTQSKLAGTLPETTAKVIYVDAILAEPVRAGDEINLLATAGPDHLAYVIYTSGTTGKPKGTMISHRNAVRLFSATEAWFQFDERDVWTLFHSTAFDFSVWEIWGALLYGGRLVVVPFMVTRSPEAFYQLLVDEKVTVLNQTPSAFRQLIQAEESVGQQDLALRYIVFGGEALEMQSLRPWFDRHGDQKPQLVNMYGITETTVHVTYRPLSKNDLDSGSVIGIPIPDLKVYILDQRKHLVPVGIPGEMYVAGAGLARGYLNRSDLTSERFIEDHISGRLGERLYRTGDLGRLLPGGDIEYLGRIDHQVKIRGFRIELGEIESVLCEYPAIRESLVLAREDVPGAKRLVAYMVTSGDRPETSELRAHLLKKLPDYMAPAVYIFLEKFPLTNNGKIDRNALPAPDQERPELAAHYVAPAGKIEVALAGIWSRVLRVDRVGAQDNFFELGGDSILSIQIISLARRAGLDLNPRLLFQHQTIRELARVVTPLASNQPVEQGLVSGSAPLTPIQHWFFEQELAEPHYYNQAFLFELKRSISADILTRALARLERHHDALRLRFAPNDGQLKQTFSAPAGGRPVEVADLSSVPDKELAAEIEVICSRAQAGLDYVNGPLWRALLIETGEDRPARFLIAVHHLAVDGVSWRILLEDLEQACKIESGKQSEKLPAKTTSFKQWADLISKAATNGTFAADVAYWQRTVSGQAGRLPVDSYAGDNTEGSAGIITVNLSESETQALLKEAPARYNTQINDLLLTALVSTFTNWTRQNGLYVDLEGHGREDIFEGVDLSRTVGWFTSVYPMHLHLEEADLGALICSVKEQLRAVPRKGLSYGVLRYLAGEKCLRSGSEPEMVFNYLGQFDQVVADSELFQFANESTGPWHSALGRRRHLLEINSMVVNQCLQVSWTYGKNRHRPETVQQLSDNFITSLKEVLTHCTATSKRTVTPSDFPLARLSQGSLDALVTRTSAVEDIYGLSPIQELFHTVGLNNNRNVLDQWHCLLSGPVDAEKFQEAWKQVIQRHAILRSSFQTSGLDQTVQVVHALNQTEWTIEDWRGLPPVEQNARWREWLRADKDRGMPLDEPLLSRFGLFRMSDESSRFLWTIPALLLDGWSWPVVFKDLSLLYDALANRRVTELGVARSYREYLAWLAEHREAEAEAFWRSELQGITEPTPLVTGSVPAPAAAKGDRSEWSIGLPADQTDRLVGFARKLKISPNTLIQAAWAVVMARQSSRTDVMFGSAFSGRPTDLEGVENVVGPFVTNLPVRVRLDAEGDIFTFLQGFHEHLLQINAHQYASAAQVQSWSAVPWRHRLFESILVVQNYAIEESALHLGESVRISEFVGPIHSKLPLLVLVEPRESWSITLVFDSRELAEDQVSRWGGDFVKALERMMARPEATLDDVFAELSPPHVQLASKPRWRVQSQEYVAPGTELERGIAHVWENMLGLERISVEQNIFDLGVHSMLVVRLHQQLCEKLKREFPLVSMFQFPTVSSLARHFAGAGDQDQTKDVLNRASRQRAAMSRMKRARQRR